MAADYLKLNINNANAFLSRDAKNAVEATRNAFAQLEKVVVQLQHNFDDSDPNNIDWTTVETALGLQPGEGHAAFTLFDGALSAISGNDLIKRVG